jgi:3-oxoacyl-[acyl-carrier protein] reductase
MNINLRGAFLCAKAVLPIMLSNGGGSIINISSITGLVGFYPGISAIAAAYSASKAGMIGLTRQLAAEYAADDIRCNAIAPGFHGGTELGKERREASTAEETARLGGAIVKRTPLCRLGRAEELAGLVVYLSSDVSRFVTGQVISHDGGWTAT